jgi:aminotransferase in exopolysaccharide biosynthesis
MAKYQYIIDKIRSVYSEPENPIPLHVPTFNGNEKKYLNECIDSTYVSSVGKFVDLFEDKVAGYTGSEKAVVCVNGTNGLHIALKLVGVEQNDEVISQSLTFIATANAISYCNAEPVFIDVDKDTMGLSPAALESFLTRETTMKPDGCYNKSSGKRIKACVPMHTFGHPCRIEEIAALCDKYKIELVEDAAESIGSYYKGKHTGTFGRIGVLSFNGNKTITTGGGGMLLFNDKDLALRAKHLTTQAKVKHPWNFVHDDVGYNYRMPNINAALGLAQLEQLDFFIEKKRLLAKSYSDFFGSGPVTFFREPEFCISNYWLNVLIFESEKERDLFLEESNEQGVMTRPVWRLMNKLSMFKNCRKDSLINSEWLEERVVNIPSSVKI